MGTAALFILVLASAGDQFGTPVFSLADAPARYNAWDEFVLYRFIASAGMQPGTLLFFLADAPATYCAWNELVFRTGSWWVRNVCC